MTSESNFESVQPYDLVTPDGVITSLSSVDEKTKKASIFIEGISSHFKGFEIEEERIFFNIKSTLAQLGVDGEREALAIDKKNRCIQFEVLLFAIDPLGQKLLNQLTVGAKIGKLFAADERRRVRDPFYLSRMLGRSDRWGRPLLSLGGLHGSKDLILDKVEGRTVAYLTLRNGHLEYLSTVEGFLPTVVKSLTTNISIRHLLSLHQEWKANAPRSVEKERMLLVKTMPLHVRTVFAHVAPELLAGGFRHTSASILEPNTQDSGDIYELFGESRRELNDIPLEFYTLEPYREHVFFCDRDQLQNELENSKTLFQAFDTAPNPEEMQASVFVVKGQQLLNLKEHDWVVREPRKEDFPGLFQGSRQALMIERYIEQQSPYPLLQQIDEGTITSQGVLLTRYFPTPLMKRMLLGNQVQRALKGIYFLYPSLSSHLYFSAQDRAFLHDLQQFAVPVYWLDTKTNEILQYIQKPERDSGLFVPLNKVSTFLKSTLFGIYGSNLLEGNFEGELRTLLEGILKMREEVTHPLLQKDTSLALVTGGGPGAMEVGNRVAKELGILSCANVVDFRLSEDSFVNEQQENPYIEAKMTYRLDKLVERQAEFLLDFPIFLKGGIGTDFEFCLEEVRRKVGIAEPTPIILFGHPEHWKGKISHRFSANKKSETNKGSEWLSNCFYCVQTAEQAVRIYRQFFENTLPIGPEGPIYEEGFCIVER